MNHEAMDKQRLKPPAGAPQHEYTYDELKLMSLHDIAQLMRDGVLPYPETHVDYFGTMYPTFPDALDEVAEANSPKCPYCRAVGYYYPADKAYAPGHCYSEAGKTDFTRITHVCEACFDNMFEGDDDDDGPADH